MAGTLQTSYLELTALNAIPALQVESSMSELWALSDRQELYSCTLPCKEKSWWKKIPNARFSYISVNPLEIWGVSAQNEVYRCKLPCKRGLDFQLVAKGFKKVSLGLSDVWGITTDNKVMQALFEFAKENIQIDESRLNWQSRGDQTFHVSVGEDGEVWAIVANQEIRRYLADKKQWAAVHGISQLVDVGADYIYGISKEEFVMRCLRPCRNGGWEYPMKHNEPFKSLSARFNNPGVVWLIGKGGKENAIRFGVGAWSAKFSPLDLAMPFYTYSREPKDKGSYKSRYSIYFVPDWHLEAAQPASPVNTLPF